MNFKYIVCVTIFYVASLSFSAQPISTRDKEIAEVEKCVAKCISCYPAVTENLNKIDSLKEVSTENGRLIGNIALKSKSWTVPQFIDFVKGSYREQGVIRQRRGRTILPSSPG